MRVPLIIDCDPGIDDFLSIILINHKSFLNPKLITAVDGSVDLDKAYRNAKTIAKILDMPIPIAKAKKDVNFDKRCEYKHGEDGFLGHSKDFSDDILPSNLDEDAITKMKEVLSKKEKRKFKILMTGPSTNIRKLFNKYPNLVKNIEEIALCEDNFDYDVTENEILIDTNLDIDSIKQLLTTKIKFSIVSNELIAKSKISSKTVEEIGNIHSQLSSMAYDMIKEFYNRKADIADTLAALSLSNPEYFENEIKSFKVKLRRENGDIYSLENEQKIYYLKNINQYNYEKEMLKMFF
ncbi:MAG: nucleoside hydrolase [Tissierellia bacterium]|nr:nucleoside hydrolase [Tissierellia bacterium]